MNDGAVDLGELERAVMQLIWSGDGVTAEAIRTRLARQPKESTVRTVLSRLEKKGLVAHHVVGRTYVFHAVQAPGVLAGRAVKRIADWLCNGSMEEMLAGLADAGLIDRPTLQRLARRIGRPKKPR